MLVAQRVQPLPNEMAGRGVEPDGRLVEEQHGGPVQERRGDLQPAQQPAGQVPRELADVRAHLHRGHRGVDPLAPLGAGNTCDRSVERKVLAAGEGAVHRDRLRHVTDRLAHSEALPAHIGACHRNVSRRG
jgi:hypothetical protein